LTMFFFPTIIILFQSPVILKIMLTSVSHKVFSPDDLYLFHPPEGKGRRTKKGNDISLRILRYGKLMVCVAIHKYVHVHVHVHERNTLWYMRKSLKNTSKLHHSISDFHVHCYIFMTASRILNVHRSLVKLIPCTYIPITF
jgi:hypothetical protein